jgi:glycosyltransferase involved in cell wall biosynthesis
MRVSLIIPTRNEEGCIGRVLSEVPRDVVDEVIVIDGNSSDKTEEEAKAELRPSDKFVNQKGKGYGGAFLEAFDIVTGDVIIMMDADGSHNPAEITPIIDKIRRGYEYVMASRYMPGGKSEDDTIIRWFGNRMFTWLTNVIHGTRVTDSLYLFTAVTKNGLKKMPLKSLGFEFCTEIVVKAHRAGLKFGEIPAFERARFAGKTKVNAFWHGLKILRMILKRYRD